MKVKKRDLEIALAKVPPFTDPDPSLEQYSTPAAVAADILFYAYGKGDIEGLKVLDLGCGTGMFSIGAWLLGAGMVVGIDVSERALITAKECTAAFGADIELRLSDICDVNEGADTVVMNPPFGCQTRKADREFLDKAMDSAECVYSVHKAETLDFIREYVAERGRAVIYNKVYKYEIPHTFSFHKKERQTVDIVAVNIR